MTSDEIIAKIRRFFKNPGSYFKAYFVKFLCSRFCVCVYRKFVLPVVLSRIRHRNKIVVVFLAMNPDMWRYDGVYRKLLGDGRFTPIIVTAMRRLGDNELLLKEQNDMISYFREKGYFVLEGYDAVNKRWLDLASLSPGIVFHTQPYMKIMENCRFSFYWHLSSLHCYVPYSFQLSKTEWNWNNPLQNYCWMQFVVGKYQLDLSREISFVRGKNAVAVGYCFQEELEWFMRKRELIDSVWKNDKRKRVIWAPHHSIMKDEWYKVSSFLEIYEFMCRIREEYRDRVIFAFKPHPALKTKLYKVWGKKRADEYYNDWENAENSFFSQGDYHALFAGSDAMIHCSGSFKEEYLYANKPVQYYYSKTRNPPELGEIGAAALSAHYSARCETDVRHFLDEVVLGQNDALKTIRENVVKKYLASPNGCLFSENVYNELISGLGLKAFS